MNSINSGLTVLHWNCNSVGNKKYYLESYLNRNETDIVLLNETKVNQTSANEKLFFNSYQTIHKSRTKNADYGGVFLLVLKKISTITRFPFQLSSIMMK